MVAMMGGVVLLVASARLAARSEERLVRARLAGDLHLLTHTWRRRLGAVGACAEGAVGAGIVLHAGLAQRRRRSAR